MLTVRIFETFTSLQGESTFAGLPCFFIRMAGCNLRCRYCDTKAAQPADAGKDVSIDSLVSAACASPAAIIEITGGEPLIQEGFHDLAAELQRKTGRPVLVETNGSCDISVIPPGVVAVMDMKCPASGECNAMDISNLKRLRPYDEVKFVISDRMDYDWARAMVTDHKLSAGKCGSILFSPVPCVLDPQLLGSWIVSDGLKVRLQVQLHKLLDVK